MARIISPLASFLKLADSSLSSPYLIVINDDTNGAAPATHHVEDIFLGLCHARPDKQNFLEERPRGAHLIPDAQTQASRGSCHQESKLCQSWISPTLHTISLSIRLSLKLKLISAVRMLQVAIMLGPWSTKQSMRYA